MTNNKTKYYKEYLLEKNWVFDTIKFIPFSFFLWVPLSEIILPFYSFYFPNAIPTYFIPKKKSIIDF